MNCYYHPDREAAAQCVICGKYLCSECNIIKEGKSYCKECLRVSESQVSWDKILIPGIISGCVAGVLSFAVWDTPFNCLCCLWIVLGGALAVFLLKRLNKITGKIGTGMAAVTGGLAGIVAGIIISVVVDLRFFVEEAMKTPDVQEMLRESGVTAEELAGITLAMFVVVIVIGFALFSALGGIIANEVTK